ncbi:hypothetical protein [Streptomyces sp. S1]|uniref:hypothetical protein n=1 Tax=Streptomyces sp. S1 TaxID=718288 RepID=UPI003D707388
MQRKQRRFMAALAVLFALICVVLVMVVLVGLDVRQQSREIKNIQDKTTTRVLCPLYQQFINADTPKARELARMSGQDMQVREQAFAVIRQGYEALNCESTTKE